MMKFSVNYFLIPLQTSTMSYTTWACRLCGPIAYLCSSSRFLFVVVIYKIILVQHYQLEAVKTKKLKFHQKFGKNNWSCFQIYFQIRFKFCNDTFRPANVALFKLAAAFAIALCSRTTGVFQSGWVGFSLWWHLLHFW